MNILYLKYAAEVAKCGSISKAAEKLFVAQPNISRAIKELEGSLGITVFERNAKGMSLTPDGERLMRYAGGILTQIEEVEEVFRGGESKKLKFSISVPRASYISRAFAGFTAKLPADVPVEILYKETNALRAINNVLNSSYRLGIIRYAERHDRYFKDMLEEKGLAYELVTEFSYRLIFHREHPLAAKETVTEADLTKYLEIAHADPFVPSLPLAEVRKEELSEGGNRRVFVFERASQFDILSVNKEAYMWVSAVPEDLLARYDLVERECADHQKIYKDMLIRQSSYRLSPLDKAFITELCNARRKYLSE